MQYEFKPKHQRERLHRLDQLLGGIWLIEAGTNTNLASEQPAVVDELRRKLDRWWAGR